MDKLGSCWWVLWKCLHCLNRLQILPRCSCGNQLRSLAPLSSLTFTGFHPCSGRVWPALIARCHPPGKGTHRAGSLQMQVRLWSLSPLPKAGLLALALLGPTLRSLRVGLNWSDFVTAFSLFTRCGLFRLIPSFQSKLDNSLLSAFPASGAG